MDILHYLLIFLLVLSSTAAAVFVIRMALAEKRATAAEASESAVRTDLEPLRPYARIRDVDAEIARVEAEWTRWTAETKATTEQRAAEVLGAASEELREAREEARAIRRKAKETTGLRVAEADRLIEAALTELDLARRRAAADAEQVLGDAWAAKRDVDRLAATAAAMKNVIEGYGDRYVVPAHGLADELAEDFSHKDAGRQLKAARSFSRSMASDGRAGACEYAQRTRSDTATRFVVDAFNGKVDSILSLIADEHVETLRQMIHDAFVEVNHNGEAFRNARILPQYRDARIRELEWASAVLELREREREEQKAIREAIREEERARREYERAIKEAEDEERAIADAMKAAEERLAAATDAQRDRYEAELEDLRRKLAAAEEKEQRAISMAQQTRRGHVYVISNIGSFGESVYKIGLTRRLEPMDRVKELGDASVPFPFDVHAMVFADDAPALEAELHRRFGNSRLNRVNFRKEFFDCGLADIRRVVEELGIEAHWTERAQAAEFRESLAMVEGRESKRDARDAVRQVSVAIEDTGDGR